MYSKGLTLVELIVVMSIISIMTVGGFFGLQYIPKLRVNSATSEGLAAFRKVQSQAISERKNIRVDFSISNTQYNIVELTIPPTIIQTVQCPSGVWFTSTFTNSKVEFTPSGTPDQPGAVIFRNNQGYFKTLNLNAIGKVEIL